MTDRYPAILDVTLKTIMTAAKGEQITPELVARATGSADNFELVKGDLERSHMLDNQGLTPLADQYARLWRQFLAGYVDNTTKEQPDNARTP